jgi:hypothetical protein
MDDNTAKVLFATVPAAISATVTWFVIRNSQRQFYAQGWEKRVESYGRIIEAVSELTDIYARFEHRYNQHGSFTEADVAEFIEAIKPGVKVIVSAVNTGPFLISSAAYRELVDLSSKLQGLLGLGGAKSPFQLGAQSLSLASNVLTGLAHRDLDIAGSRPLQTWLSRKLRRGSSTIVLTKTTSMGSRILHV